MFNPFGVQNPYNAFTGVNSGGYYEGGGQMPNVGQVRAQPATMGVQNPQQQATPQGQWFGDRFFPVFNANNFRQGAGDWSYVGGDNGGFWQNAQTGAQSANAPTGMTNWGDQNERFAPGTWESLFAPIYGDGGFGKGNFIPTFGEDGTLQSLQIKNADRGGAMADYVRDENGNFVPTNLRDSYMSTNQGDFNRSALMAAAVALGGPAAMSYFGGGAAGAAGAGNVAQSFPVAMPGAAQTSALPALGGGAGAAGAAGAGAAGAAGAGGAGAAGGAGSLLSNLGSAARVVAPIVGAVAGAQGSGPQTSTTTQSLPPWLNALGPEFANRALAAANTPDPGLEGFTADQRAGFDAVRNQANSSLTGDASGLLSRTMRGDYLTGNPYLEGMVKQTTDDLQGRFNTTALGSGSFGNANATQQGMQGIANAANTLRFQNYDAERNRQMQAVGLAPSINNMGLTNANALLSIGDQQQQFGQMQRDRPFDWQMRQLDALSKPFGFNQGGSTSTTQPGTNRWAGALGGALTAAQLWSLFGR